MRDEVSSRPPLIPVCGFWLPDYGFHRGTAVRVFAKYGEIRLVLEAEGPVREPRAEKPPASSGLRRAESLAFGYHSV